MRAYFGHHKCGSTWVWELIARVCRETGVRHSLVLDEQTPHAHGPLVWKLFGSGREGARNGTFEREALHGRARRVGAEFVSCITADREQLEALAPERGFHVIRDPRDIIVSGYFSHRNSHPTDGLPHLAEHRARLQSASKDEGLVLEMDFAQRELLDLWEWDYDRPEILELRLEDLSARPYDGFVRIFQHLGLLSAREPTLGRELLGISRRRAMNRISHRRMLGGLRREMPVTGEILLGAVYQHRFEAKTKGRAAGAEDQNSHYRKGVAGDWAHHFTDESVVAFKARFPGLLHKLGYERAEDWGLSSRPLAAGRDQARWTRSCLVRGSRSDCSSG